MTSKHNIGTQLTEIRFYTIVKFDNASGFLTINNPDHNHEITLRDSHLVLYRMWIINNVQDIIVTLSRKLAMPITIPIHLWLDRDLEDPIF